MMFEITLDSSLTETKPMRINRRKAVRAVVIKDEKLLMVHSKLGDYKFPGGGVKPGEGNEAALIREVLEETGYYVSNIKEKLGHVITISNDDQELGSIFEMESHYYLCEISDKQVLQQLDAYEEELEFKPAFISLDAAISNNEAVLQTENYNFWVQRETRVLYELKKYKLE